MNARAGGLARVTAMLGVVVMLAFVLFCGWWRLQGGRWERVETPSMGTRAPVGSLLWVLPVAASAVRPGDFVTFHPPGSRSTYSHLVRSVDPGGELHTQGVITAPDPWTVRQGDVVGEVRMVWPAVGWVAAAAPVLVAGLLGLVLVRRFAAEPVRPAVTVLGASLVLTVAVVWLHPLAGAVRLGTTVTEAEVRATYVGTGLVPVRVAVADGSSLLLRPGRVGSVAVERRGAPPVHQVLLTPRPPWWWSLLIVVGCFLPAVRRLGARHNPPSGEPLGGS